ncbi:tetratricopeptide repeat protein [Paenactinomyces guangxiensis]|uniref:Tetratricopeptide repeat protein n=1 Tax=Paenactinomyces guangxiensis TaxID=1490290 RepID=A0A7W2A5Y6_9BACL|nr:tetratricopeptide repeat protein [Paenactinomyces guangxiensis]MBA4492811.1 tetratricopeptide repeat protein [Paenactinomyces guangxiensis]MBH8590340.1 tetratricopeptide repeat protein [Paenactinomyces guangxiensis]
MAGPMFEVYSIVYKQGKKQVVQGSYRRNRARIERLIKKDPQADYYLALAHLEARNRQWDRAQAAIGSALELEPLCAEAQLLLAQVLEAKNELQPSNDAYQSVLNCHPDFSRGYREYARYLMTHSDSLRLAQNLLLRSLELDPKDALAHTLLAEVYLLQSHTRQALLHLELAAHYHEGQPFYHQRTANLFMKMEQYDEAAKQLKLALRIDPKNKLIRSQFRQVLKETNSPRFSSLWKRWGI